MKKTIEIEKLHELLSDMSNDDFADYPQFDTNANDFFDMFERMIQIPKLNLHYCFERCAVTYDFDLLDDVETLAKFAKCDDTLLIVDYLRMLDNDIVNC